MEIGVRSRSRSRTRRSSRSGSISRRSSIVSKRSLSSSSLTKLNITPTHLEGDLVVPQINANLDNSLPLDFLKQDIWALIKALRIGKWHKKNLDINKINVNRISGALTNSIYKLEYKDDTIKIPSLLLRVYGKNVDNIIDRDLELDTLVKLSSKKIGPKLLGIFSNGRFEQFLEGFITLDRFQIRDEVISQMLGRRMKDLHYKVSLEYNDIKDNMPSCWRLIYKWIDILENDGILDNFRSNGVKDEDIFLMSFEQFKVHIDHYKQWLFEKYDTMGFASNLKFCHNDTQYGNLLLHESFSAEDIIISDSTPNDSSTSLSTVIATSNKRDTSLVVIDFEYSGANFSAFDLVNHFCEWMTNYHDPLNSYFLNEKLFPSQVEQLNLIKAYVEYDFQYPSSNLKVDLPDLNHVTPSDLVQFEIKKLYNECVFWRCSVSIFWSIWGLIQNGPLKSSVNALAGEVSHEVGVGSTYTITTGLTSLELAENVIEDEITSSDDDFNYLKFSQQKAALAIGDLLQLGLLSKDELSENVAKNIKYLDCGLFDL